jgi:hypothetical protein
LVVDKRVYFRIMVDAVFGAIFAEDMSVTVGVDPRF